MNVTKIAVNIDMSRPVLEELANAGYTHVRWIRSETACPICERLDGKVWTLSKFLTGLEHDAPIYEHAHPGCVCFLQVFSLKSPDGETPVDELFPPVVIEAWGNSSY